MLCNSIHVEWRCSLQLCWWWRRRRMFLWRQAVETVPATGRWEKDMIICYMLNYGRFVILSGTHIVLHKLQYTMFEANSAFHPSRVGKWVLRFGWEGKCKYGSFVSGWTRGVQVKLWDPLRTRAIPERLRGMFTTERYTNPRLSLPLPFEVVHLWPASTECLQLLRMQQKFRPLSTI